MIESTEKNIEVLCPKCGNRTVKDGKSKGRQTYKCKSPICGYRHIPKEFHRKISKKARPPLACSICGEPHIALGLCQKHYRQMRRGKGKDTSPTPAPEG